MILEEYDETKNSMFNPYEVENKLHVAVNNGDDSFEYNVLNPINEEEIEQDIIKDIKLITDFVNELNLDNNLFKKEA